MPNHLPPPPSEEEKDVQRDVVSPTNTEINEILLALYSPQACMYIA